MLRLRAAADRRPAGKAVQQSIDISHPPGPPHAAAAGEWDRQTDGHRTGS